MGDKSGSSPKTGTCVCCSLRWHKRGRVSRWGYCSACFLCAGPIGAGGRHRDRIINRIVRWLYNLRSENNQRA